MNERAIHQIEVQHTVWGHGHMSKLQFTRVVRVHYLVRPLLGVTDAEEDERDEMTRRTTVGEVAYKLNQLA